MITHALSVSSPVGDEYDELYPTRQTELLCLELRKILYGLDGAVIRHAEEADIAVLDTSMSAMLESFISSEDSAVEALEGELPIPLPGNMPDILGDITGLVLAGVANPLLALGIKVLLPVIGRVIARKMGVPGYSGAGQDVIPALTTIADRICDDSVSPQSLTPTLNQLSDILDLVLIDSTGSVLKTYEEGESEFNGTSVFCGLTALGERISALTRIVEELQAIMESKAVAIMHTSESDKVVYITD